MKKIIEVFAENLRNCRKAIGLTQEQLAEVADISTNYIARLETGISTPSFAALINLSNVLRIRASDLLATEYEPAPPSEVGITANALLEPLTDQEAEHVLSQLRNTVRFILSHRKMKQDQ